MTGYPAILVDPRSATHGRLREQGTHYVDSINRAHSELVKFNSRQDEVYKAVRSRFKSLLQRDTAQCQRKCLEEFEFRDHKINSVKRYLRCQKMKDVSYIESRFIQ